MTDRLFNAPGANHGSAAEQLRNLLAMRAKPEAAGAVADDIVDAAAVAAAAPEGIGVGAAVPTALDDAAHVAAGIPGGDIDALAKAAQQAAMAGAVDPAAQQVIDVQVQPRLIVQGQAGPIVIPVDVAVPAAQARVNIATPVTMIVDPLTGQAIAVPAAAAAADAAAAAPAATPNAGGLGAIRSMNAEEFGALFRRGGAGPAAVEAVAAADAKPSILEQLRGAAEAAGVRRGAVEGAEVVATPAANRGANLLDELRAGIGAIAPRAEAAAPAAAEAIEAAVKPNLVEDLLRAASRVNPRG